MADRRPVPPPRTVDDPRVPAEPRIPRARRAEPRAGESRGRPVSTPDHPVSPGAAPSGGLTGVGFTTNPDAPLLDLIFPNREQTTTSGFEPTAASVEQAAGFGRPAPRAASLFRRRARVTRAPATGRRRVNRRKVLLGLGTGVVVAGAAGAGITLFTGGLSSAPATTGSDVNTADGLGAAGLADSPSAAAKIAAAATPTVTSPLVRDAQLHLLRRATFGLNPIDVVAVRQLGIDAWLERQFAPVDIADPVEDRISTLYPTVGMTTAQIRATVKDGDYLPMMQLGQATIARQIWSNRQLYEVMVDFWANHLNVVNPMDGGWDIRGSYDRDVIRAHTFGRFIDMLFASARHPAMMRYLNNDQSDKRSVNENYGRELLELHTVGLDAKYTEKDVRQSAYILTGRTIDNVDRFTYDASRHYTGKVTVMGFTNKNNRGSQGLTVGDAYVNYLALHPSTANRIAFKLARRFVCDDPPTTLVDRLAQSYLDNGSAIIPVLRTLFSSVEFWMATGLKTRRPLENVVATARILGVGMGQDTAQGLEGLYSMVDQLGHAPLRWSPPDGYADYADAWGSAHATLGTWNAHRALVRGYHEGLGYPDTETLVGTHPSTVGQYLDLLIARLLYQPMLPKHRAAMLSYLGYKDSTKVKTLGLGGKLDSLIPLLLDSVYHTLR